MLIFFNELNVDSLKDVLTSLAPEPTDVTLFEKKKIFAYVIEYLAMRSSWIIQVGLHTMTSVFIRDTHTRDTWRRQAGPVKTEAVVGVV